MALRWYVVHAYSNFENKVKHSLEERVKRMGLEHKFGKIIVPTEEVVEMREGQKRRSDRKFFPGYVLVQMEMDEDTWHLVKEVPKVLFEPGEVVRVTDGPFNDFNGVVEQVNYDKNKLRVAVQILGRSTPVELDFSQVEKG
jgi:transcriptional antiterminator NusG